MKSAKFACIWFHWHNYIWNKLTSSSKYLIIIITIFCYFRHIIYLHRLTSIIHITKNKNISPYSPFNKGSKWPLLNYPFKHDWPVSNNTEMRPGVIWTNFVQRCNCIKNSDWSRWTMNWPLQLGGLTLRVPRPLKG